MESSVRWPIARILIIDDDSAVRNSLRTYFERVGYQVAEAGDGRACLRLHAAAPADVIITDLFMPDVDGIEIIRELRRMPGRVKVIVVSGGDSTGTLNMLDHATLLGADRTFHKPLDPEALLEAVRELLNTSSQR